MKTTSLVVHRSAPALPYTLDPIVVSPCPFCGGPPTPIAVRGLPPFVVFQPEELAVPDGLYVKASVFCHECGAEGEEQSAFAHNQDDVDLLLYTAVENWNRRDSRNQDLYEASEKDGLNVWPRADHG